MSGKPWKGGSRKLIEQLQEEEEEQEEENVSSQNSLFESGRYNRNDSNGDSNLSTQLQLSRYIQSLRHNGDNNNTPSPLVRQQVQQQQNVQRIRQYSQPKADEKTVVEQISDVDLLSNTTSPVPLSSRSTDRANNNNNNDNNGNRTVSSNGRSLHYNNGLEYDDDDQTREEYISEGQGRMVGSRIVFDDIFDDIKNKNIQNIRKQQPPYVPSPTNEELVKIIEHELERIKTKEKIITDDYAEFVTLVAGDGWIDMSLLVNSPSGRGVSGSVGSALQGYPGSRGGGGGIGGRVIGNATTGVSPLGVPGSVFLSHRTSPRNTAGNTQGPNTETPLGGRKRLGEFSTAGGDDNNNNTKNLFSFSGPRMGRSVTGDFSINNNNSNRRTSEPEGGEEEGEDRDDETLAREEAERQRSRVTGSSRVTGGDGVNTNVRFGIDRNPFEEAAVEANRLRLTRGTEEQQSILRLLQDKEWRSRAEDWLSRNRMYNNITWIERPDVLGIMDLSPMLFSAMKMTHTAILLQGGENFLGVTIDDLVKERGVVTNLYAAATASKIKLTKSSGPRPQYESSDVKFRMEFNTTVATLVGTYKFDESTRTFEQIGTYEYPNSNRTKISYTRKNPFATTRDGNLYPKYY